MDTSTHFAIRVRQGEREIEVRGAEEFVREVSEDLIERFLGDEDFQVVEEPSGTTAIRPAGMVVSGQRPTFRDLLTSAPQATAAERVVMAAVTLLDEGVDTFDVTALSSVFDRAFEKQPNFWREIPKAAKAGWLMRATGNGKRQAFKLTHRGMEHIRELARGSELQ